jgi:anti-anti-sigma factor
MNCAFAQDDSTVSLSGELKFTDHAEFREMMNRLLGTKDVPLVIELSRLTFVDSAGLGMLLIVREEADKARRRLTLRGPVGHVARMFQVSKFDKLFTIEPATG